MTQRNPVLLVTLTHLSAYVGHIIRTPIQVFLFSKQS
jgi:hypothetical protein